MMYENDFERPPREKGDFLLGLPALLGVLAAVPFLSFIWSRESKLDATYRTEALRSYDNEQYELAVVCLDRITRQNPRDQDRYHLALALRESGDPERSERILKGLAAKDEQGYGPAHVYLAKEILNREGVDLNQATDAIAHLTHAKKTMYKDPEVSYLLALCYWVTGSQQQALESLQDAAKLDGRFYYDLFKACQQRRLLDAANRSAAMAMEYYAEQVAQQPLDRGLRHRYVELQVWLNAFDDAEKTLQQGAKVDQDGQWSKVLSSTYLARFRQRKSQKASLDELLTYLEKASQADPENEDVLKVLSEVGLSDSSGRIDKMLEEALTTGRHNAIVHFVLGSRKWQLNLADEAAFHMKRAYEMDNSLVYAANNLAYMECLKEDGNYQAGLDMINKILEKNPKVHKFRETRGQLLTKLERWEDALDDLEYALEELPGEVPLHQSLALCYEKLGQSSLAQRHRDLAKSLALQN